MGIEKETRDWIRALRKELEVAKKKHGCDDWYTRQVIRELNQARRDLRRIERDKV